MPKVTRDVVVIGASAGGVEALRVLIGGLPRDLPAAVLVVLHMPAGGTSALSAILNRAGQLTVESARDGTPLRHGHVYTAPPDYHLLVSAGTLTLSRGPSENGHRPAVNTLFRSAARALGPRCVGVVLSGTLDDGAAGLSSIVSRGGAAVIQAPGDAIYAGMPEAALREVATSHVCPVDRMAQVIGELVREKVDPDAVPALGRLAAVEADLAEHGEWQADYEAGTMSVASGYSCPDCQGALLALPGTNRYRCRVGHAWSADALFQQKSDELERALWMALRTLDERTSLANRMRKSATERNSLLLAARYQESAEESEHAAATLRAFLHTGAVSANGDG